MRTIDKKTGVGGTVDGSCEIVDVVKMKKKDLHKYENKHSLDEEGWAIMKNYKDDDWIYGFLLTNIVQEKNPWKYPPTSAVRWVRQF